MDRVSSIHAALAPPPDVSRVEELVPEFGLSRGVGQGPYHHLDVHGHVLEVVRETERELQERRTGARVEAGRVEGLRLAALLHDVAKPLTRGEFEGRVIFVAHDTLGARLAHRICRRLGVSAQDTDIATTLTALHLKIGFMGNKRTDYPPARLVPAAGPFGEELTALSWADRLAAQGPRLKDEHLDRHLALCREFLEASREPGPFPQPDYEEISSELELPVPADAGYAAGRLRLLEARGLGRREAMELLARSVWSRPGGSESR